MLLFQTHTIICAASVSAPTLPWLEDSSRQATRRGDVSVDGSHAHVLKPAELDDDVDVVCSALPEPLRSGAPPWP